MSVERPSVSDLLRVHERVAVARHQIPQSIVRRASRATSAALGSEPPSGTLSARVRGYFWAVVRREMLRSSEARSANARLVLGAVVDDLIDAGRSTRDVWTELERGWSHIMPLEILEEYRERLCA
jgi:hypothetical protein